MELSEDRYVMLEEDCVVALHLPFLIKFNHFGNKNMLLQNKTVSQLFLRKIIVILLYLMYLMPSVLSSNCDTIAFNNLSRS
jgi:hypothetical protein